MREKVEIVSSLDEILNGCKKGNVLYQEQLYKHYYGYALSICRLYTYSNNDAVSVLNDSFLKAFKSIRKSNFNDVDHFKNWLRKY